MLSQHTSDTNRDRAFAGLKQRFPSWESVAEAHTTELADAIRPGGIADVKAGRIKGILDEILEQEGALNLDRLNELTDEDVERYLVALPGVGPKTAACVLVFSMGRDAFPIDTHVYRIAVRLGWIGPKVTADAAHRILTPRIPPELRYDLHVAFIDHGRSVCKPKLPRCTECVLFDLCDAGPRFLAAGEAR
ncbi:MAG: endonuclease [Actinomycetota bacterium]|nr:endonuclease [Actinomycetota bacterium]